MPSNRILICGAGVAGSTLAYWLGKHNFSVVVVERSSAEQKAGQGIDLEGSGLQIVTMMGVLDKIQAKTTGELGFAVVDEHSRPWATFTTAQGPSLTKNIEIMRGELTEILAKAADGFPNVTFRYETTVQSLRHTRDSVIVELEDKHGKSLQPSSEEFDVVVGADGVRSRARQMAIPSPESDYLKPVGCSVAYFSIPAQPQDWPYSRLCQFPGRRVLCIRPRGQHSTESSVYLVDLHDASPALQAARNANDRQAQKEAFAAVFADLGWEVPRVLAAMLAPPNKNFYLDTLCQVKLDRWSEGRVVLVGDAAWAPTPLTGEGTELALLGAYVLAQELARSPTKAFERYEARLRGCVEGKQKLFLGGYGQFMVCPQTRGGIWLFRAVAWVLAWAVRLVAWTGVSWASSRGEDAGFDLEVEEGTVKR